MAGRYRTKTEEVIAIQVPGADADPEAIQEFMAWIFTSGKEGAHTHWTVSSNMDIELVNGSEGEKTFVSEGDYMVKNAHGMSTIRAMTERSFGNQFTEIDTTEKYKRDDAMNMVKDIAGWSLDGEDHKEIPDAKFVLENDKATAVYANMVTNARDIING